MTVGIYTITTGVGVKINWIWVVLSEGDPLYTPEVGTRKVPVVMGL